MQYKKGRHIASKRNSVTVCGLPSSHLPLTREASLVRGKAVDVLLRRLWGWRGLMQREGQAPRPTKSEWDSANAKPYKHTDDCITKSDGDSADAKQAERSLKGKGVGVRQVVAGIANA